MTPPLGGPAASAGRGCRADGRGAGLRRRAAPLVLALSLVGSLVGAPPRSLAASAAARAADAPPERPAVVLTDAGAVQGERGDGVVVFRGIPYAAAPVGERRFRPPAPVPRWAAVRDARDFLPACPQLVERDPTENNNSVMAEDCLGVNVWTPAADHRRRPVMVFLHGGAYIEGSTRNSWYDGASLARRGDVVVVTLQYRLGALGFLELADLGGRDYAESGNLGLLDQVAALQWVRRNIGAFGGDAANVTLFGESVGATSAAILMAMPAAEGLFQKVILESNSGTRVGHKRAKASEIARGFLAAAHVSTVAELRQLRWQDIRDAQARYFESAFGDSSFGPTFDGVVIPQLPMKAVNAGRVARIPVLIGTNQDEIRFWSEIEELPLTSKPPAKLRAQLAAFAGDRADAIIATYARRHPDYGEALLQLETDALWRLITVRTAEALCDRQPVYLYLFTYRSTAPQARYGAAHSMEIPFVFGGIDAPDAIAFTGRSPARRPLMAAMQSAWIAFARTGDPSVPGGLAWPRYDRLTRQTMEFGVHSRVVDDPGADERRAWDGVPFDNERPNGDQATALVSDN